MLTNYSEIKIFIDDKPTDAVSSIRFITILPIINTIGDLALKPSLEIRIYTNDTA